MKLCAKKLCAQTPKKNTDINKYGILIGPWNLCDLGGLLVGGWSVIGALILGWSVNIPTNNIASTPCKIVGWYIYRPTILHVHRAILLVRMRHQQYY